MKLGLLVIATEILEGKIVDLNTRSLAYFLKKHHLELNEAHIVRDHEDDIKRGFSSLLNNCDFIITSGGLGPTQDDLTKNVLASFLNTPITYSDLAHKVASENYERLQRPYPGKQHEYSLLPEGVKPLSNSTGFAPGLFAEHQGKSILCAPGVPREFDSMLQDHFLPWIEKNHRKDCFMENVVFRTRRVPEEKIFGEVDPELWNKLSNEGDVSSLPGIMGVDIGIKIQATDELGLSKKREAIISIMENSPVKKHIWHQGEARLEEVIVKLANEKGITFGFAESCTGGLCSHRITNISGSSKSFMGSVISYDEAVKINKLAVPSELIADKGVVSLEVAEAMAEGLGKTLNIDFAVSITGIAGPNGGSPELPVGSVCIGLHVKDKTIRSFKLRLFGDREQLKERFAQAALMVLHEGMEEFA
jgi:nicotinamide-nucleotide amidase